MLDFDLAIRRGAFALSASAALGARVTGILGPSGAGKSTLLATIAGLLRPAAGWIRLDGETLDDVAARVHRPPWRRHIGVVFQDGLLFPHLTVRGNLRYGHDRLRAAERRFTLSQIAALLEIEPLLERRPTLLSGGERQRVALGRALLWSPRLLLLDEPLSALDERLKGQVLPFLRRVRDDLGIPMVYVSHQRAELDYLADTVLALRDGRLGPG